MMDLNRYDFTWTGFMGGSRQSVPIGNGDLGANVWLESDGSVYLLLAKTDNWSEGGRLLKTGLLRLTLTPNPFDEQTRTSFSLEDACMRLCAENARVSVWADANAPCYRVEIEANTPVRARLQAINYRDDPSVEDGDRAFPESADRLLARGSRLYQYHRNETSVFPEALRQQTLERLANEFRDPLLGRTFGFAAFGEGFQADGDALTSDEMRRHALCVISHAGFFESAQSWLDQADALCERCAASDFEAHREAWRAFWAEHYLLADGCEDAETLTRAYLYQRYLNRCAGLGAMPIKFNGSLFVAYPSPLVKERVNYDYRQWGGGYWIQNTRLIYWNMLLCGDLAMMKPFFRMLIEMIPLNSRQVREIYGHEGIRIPESGPFYGLAPFFPRANERGEHMQYENRQYTPARAVPGYCNSHFNGMLECAHMMLRYLAFGGDRELEEGMLEFVRQTLLFFDQHFYRLDGVLHIHPASSLESWWICLNNLPDVAGLRAVIEGALALPEADEDLKALCRRLLGELPELPTGEKHGKRCLLPAEIVIDRVRRNWENPELYAIFPYALYGPGKPGLDVAVASYRERDNKLGFGWSQDAWQAALLGLSDEAKSIALSEARALNADAIFPGIWGPNYDETPDQDHGSNISGAFLAMALQSDETAHRLLPAWPKAWNARFRLPLCGGGTVTGEYANGALRNLEFSDEADRARAILPRQ